MHLSSKEESVSSTNIYWCRLHTLQCARSQGAEVSTTEKLLILDGAHIPKAYPAPEADITCQVACQSRSLARKTHSKTCYLPLHI